MTELKHTPSGIYRITNTLTGQHYVGSSVNMLKRWRRHRDDLRHSKHHSLKLQRAWTKYGEPNFEFVILETIEDKLQLIAREQYWLDTLKSAESGYNILRVAGSNLGYVPSQETREKIRAIRLGSKASEEAKANMSKAGKVRMADPAERARAGAIHKGRKRSAEACANISEGKRGKVISAEARQNMSVAQKARAPASAETRAKIAALHTGSKRSDETRARMSETQKRVMNTPERKAQVSALHKGKTISAEQREMISKALSGRKRTVKPSGNT